MPYLLASLRVCGLAFGLGPTLTRLLPQPAIRKRHFFFRGGSEASSTACCSLSPWGLGESPVFTLLPTSAPARWSSFLGLNSDIFASPSILGEYGRLLRPASIALDQRPTSRPDYPRRAHLSASLGRSFQFGRTSTRLPPTCRTWRGAGTRPLEVVSILGQVDQRLVLTVSRSPALGLSSDPPDHARYSARFFTWTVCW